MRITDVEAMMLDTGKDYPNPDEASEAHGVRFLSLIKITTDEGICGWADAETQPHVGRQIVNAPSGGEIGFESIRRALIGEDPLERERVWQKMYRFMAYYGRQGAGMQMISAVDNALWDIASKPCTSGCGPCCPMCGAAASRAAHAPSAGWTPTTWSRQTPTASRSR